MVKTYISLTKPGIIWGNLVAATGGFMLAAQGHPNLFLYLITMLGVSLVVASGCVFNNVIDIDIDEKMARTESRALVTGRVSHHAALVFATVLGTVGFSVLYIYTNLMTLYFAALGFFVYVVLYTLWSKRKSIHGTLVGSVSGACPPVMGYVSNTSQLDTAASLIFLGFCAWQMPHSYAIGIFREQDFRNSRIPLVPLVKGYANCQKQMLVYIILFLLCVFGLFYFKYIGFFALAFISAICFYWIYQAIFLFKPDDPEFIASVWGKKMFITSIFAITIFSIMISVDYVVR